MMTSGRHRYVLLGPQGSGKGTQGALLSQEIGVEHISTGILFRSAIADRTALGVEIAETMARGDLISDETVNRLIAGAFAKQSSAPSYILDGYPRTLPQLAYLEKLAAPRLALLFTLTDEEAVNRLAGRLVCTQCEAIYHISRRPPKSNGVCDQCGGVIAARSDDTPEAIRRRLKQYHDETEPLLTEYERAGKLIRIDGRPDADTVYVEVRRVLGLLQ
ncbi:MAG: nucleoside monophosphate kinase [Patescibacteria group bacterium]